MQQEAHQIGLDLNRIPHTYAYSSTVIFMHLRNLMTSSFYQANFLALCSVYLANYSYSSSCGL